MLTRIGRWIAWAVLSIPTAALAWLVNSMAINAFLTDTYGWIMLLVVIVVDAYILFSIWRLLVEHFVGDAVKLYSTTQECYCRCLCGSDEFKRSLLHKKHVFCSRCGVCYEIESDEESQPTKKEDK